MNPLDNIIGSTWAEVIGDEFNKEYMRKLSGWLSHTRQSITIYPEGEDVFKALKLCPFDKVKVIILGKEPYANGEADGLSFSFKEGQGLGQGKQSIDIILDEIERDVYDGFNVNKIYQLDYLAKQGVLLLNSVLTVQRKKVDSHKGFGWETFTSRIINALIEENTPKCFLLWGKDAQQVFYNTEYVRNHTDKYLNHLILNTYHPAYDLHKRDSFGNVIVRYPNGFTGCKHFSQANKFLIDTGRGVINWLESDLVLTDQPPF